MKKIDHWVLGVEEIRQALVEFLDVHHDSYVQQDAVEIEWSYGAQGRVDKVTLKRSEGEPR